MAMEDARYFCQQRHGDLVSIDSQAERIFLWQQISKNYGAFWIGLNVDLDGTHEWMDGSQLVFQAWEVGQPDFKNFDENCAVMLEFNDEVSSNVGNYNGIGSKLQGRGHKILIGVLVFVGIAIVAAIAFFLFKKSHRHLTIPGKITTFDNPLFFSNDQSPPDVVDIGAKEEDTNNEPVPTM
ncbi:hypothetical protein INR49_013232 [Caranx melampygus]|nr:hypothetical protein INR49_013232 [Caranx melampygus]